MRPRAAPAGSRDCPGHSRWRCRPSCAPCRRGSQAAPAGSASDLRPREVPAVLPKLSFHRSVLISMRVVNSNSAMKSNRPFEPVESPVRGVFVDANSSLAEIFERQRKPGHPEIRVQLDPNMTPEQWPDSLGGAAIRIVDHTALPTAIAQKCAGLKHVVFLGTGARSYMNPEELANLGI